MNYLEELQKEQNLCQLRPNCLLTRHDLVFADGLCDFKMIAQDHGYSCLDMAALDFHRVNLRQSKKLTPFLKILQFIERRERLAPQKAFAQFHFILPGAALDLTSNTQNPGPNQAPPLVLDFIRKAKQNIASLTVLTPGDLPLTSAALHELRGVWAAAALDSMTKAPPLYIWTLKPQDPLQDFLRHLQTLAEADYCES